MFGKVKKILGIEGVKLELFIPEKVNKETGIVTGVMKFTSLSDDNKIESIHLKIVEKYTRGRGNSKLINEYVMDRLQDNNFFTSGLVKLAKKLRGVHSEFSVRAEVSIKGTTLNPFDVKPVQLI